jgi:hypothetical protein
LNDDNNELNIVAKLSLKVQEKIHTAFQKVSKKLVIITLGVPLIVACVTFFINPKNIVLIYTNTIIFSGFFYILIFFPVRKLSGAVLKWLLRGFLFGLGFVLALWFSLFLALILGLQLADKIFKLIL